MKKPRAYTVDEMREKFLDHLIRLKDYWLNEARTPDTAGKMDGMLFSFLVMFDGGNLMMPAFDITPSVHPDDIEYHKTEGENWWAQEVINDCQLHEEYCARNKK